MPLMVWVTDPTSAEPERVLVELLAHPFRLQGILPAVQRLQQCQGRSNQAVAREHAAQPDGPLVRDHRDQRVYAVVGTQLLIPSALRRGAAQAGGSNLAYLHDGHH